MVLVPLVAVMLFIALWPKALVDATTPAVEQNIAPAQVAADRPADQIEAPRRAQPASLRDAAARRRRRGRRRRRRGGGAPHRERAAERRRRNADHHRGGHRDRGLRRRAAARPLREAPRPCPDRDGGIVAAVVMSAVLWGDREEAFGGGFRADCFSLLLNMIFQQRP